MTLKAYKKKLEQYKLMLKALKSELDITTGDSRKFILNKIHDIKTSRSYLTKNKRLLSWHI